MTAKEDGLWDLKGDVTGEDVRHMKARVEIFRATHVVGEDPNDFYASPMCAESWCRWVVVDSVAYATRQAPRNFPGGAPSRQPLRGKPLPALGSVPRTRAATSIIANVTAGQKAAIAQKREEALRRKRQKQSLVPSVLPLALAISAQAFASHLALLGFAFCPCSGVGGVELWWWRIGDAMADADGDFGRKHPDSMARSCCAACCTVWAFATAPAAARGCGRARRVGSWQATFCGVLAVLLALDVGAGVLHLLRLPRGHGLFVCASCHSYDFW